MPDITSSRDPLQPLTSSEERRRTGRYVAGGSVLAVTLLTLHHVLLRNASTIAGVCIPMIIMACYVLWVLYSARRDRRKARRLASAMQLTEVISSEPGDMNSARTSRETMGVVVLEPHDTGMTTALGRPPPVTQSTTKACEANGIGRKPVDKDHHHHHHHHHPGSIT